MKEYKRRPRLVVDIDEEMERRLNKYFRWGDRSRFFRIVIEDILDFLDQNPDKVRYIFAAFMTRKLSATQVSDLFYMEDSEDA